MNNAIYLQDDQITLTENLINTLRGIASESPLRRARYCFHKDENDPVQEMVIAFFQNSYVAPHRHNGRPESLAVIQGKAAVFIFDDNGMVKNCFFLGSSPGDIPFYRINGNIWHTLIPCTEFLVVHEISRGPFSKKNNDSAPWAPDGKDIKFNREYTSKLFAKVNSFFPGDQ